MHTTVEELLVGVLCVLYCIYFGPRNPEDIGQVNVQQYKPQNN
jgi:hypothetical protein